MPSRSSLSFYSQVRCSVPVFKGLEREKKPTISKSQINMTKVKIVPNANTSFSRPCYGVVFITLRKFPLFVRLSGSWVACRPTFTLSPLTNFQWLTKWLIWVFLRYFTAFKEGYYVFEMPQLCVMCIPTRFYLLMSVRHWLQTLIFFSRDDGLRRSEDST